MQALPRIATAVSSNPDAYVYLAESIRAWPDQEGLATRITAAGWREVKFEPYDFAIRAGRETWEGFCSEVPPPMCHGIWSATFQRDMTLEGNHLVIMQNLRVLTRQLELLRVMGCRFAQGHLFAAAIEADAVPSLVPRKAAAA